MIHVCQMPCVMQIMSMTMGFCGLELQNNGDEDTLGMDYDASAQ